MLFLDPVTIVVPHFMCILHGAYHPLAEPCETAIVSWLEDRPHLTEADARDAYQAAVEQKMLDDLTREPRPRPGPDLTTRW